VPTRGAPFKGSPNAPILIALLRAPVGYLAFAFSGYWMIELFSDNALDRFLEASMTPVFVIGPGGAIIGFIAGLVLGSRDGFGRGVRFEHDSLVEGRGVSSDPRL